MQPFKPVVEVWSKKFEWGGRRIYVFAFLIAVLVCIVVLDPRGQGRDPNIFGAPYLRNGAR